MSPSACGTGCSVQANYAYAFGRKTWRWPSLREDWTYIDSGAGSDHTFKANWTFELPFGQGKKFATGANRWINGVIGGWEVDGLMRWQSGQKFNFGGFRLVGMNEAGASGHVQVLPPHGRQRRRAHLHAARRT